MNILKAIATVATIVMGALAVGEAVLKWRRARRKKKRRKSNLASQIF